MARVFSGSGNTEARTKLELTVSGLIVMNGGTPGSTLVDRIMRDVASTTNYSDIMSVSPAMLAHAEGIVKAALNVADPANANKLAHKSVAEATEQKPVSLVDRLRERDMRAQTETSNGLPSGRRSSAQFTDLKDESNPAYQDALRTVRSLPGMEWAANNRELLRLGPAAIQTLHKAEVSGKSYMRFTKEAGFKDKDAVAIVGKLHDEGISGKEIDKKLEATSDMTKSMKQHDPAGVEAFRKANNDFMLAPAEQRPEMWKRVEEATKRARETSPEAQRQFDKYKQEAEKLKGMNAEQHTAENKVTAATNAKAANADAANASELAMFNDPGKPTAPSETKQDMAPSKDAAAKTDATKVNDATAARPTQVTAAKPKPPSGPSNG